MAETAEIIFVNCVIVTKGYLTLRDAISAVQAVLFFMSASATIKSSGVVTLILSYAPMIIFTGLPSRVTSEPSSVPINPSLRAF